MKEHEEEKKWNTQFIWSTQQLNKNEPKMGIREEWNETEEMKKKTHKVQMQTKKRRKKNEMAENTQAEKMSNEYHVIETFIKQIHQTN